MRGDRLVAAGTLPSAAPHRRNPRYDLDLASYGIVKPIWKRRDRPIADWHWEPKQAFHAVALHYGRAKAAADGAAL